MANRYTNYFEANDDVHDFSTNFTKIVEPGNPRSPCTPSITVSSVSSKVHVDMERGEPIGYLY